ncbi:MAG: hypothetical protein ABI175_25760 [Polyangiales bacterium]
MRVSPVRLLVASSLVAALCASTGDAGAVSIIKDPNPPKYSVEIEPHLNLNFGGWGVYHGYNSFGWGPGVRFSIPVLSPGFIKTINNSIAISFGADLLNYAGHRYYCNGKNCNAYFDSDSFWALYVPVTMQWNFWLTDKWSVMGEPGLAIRHAFVSSDYCNRDFYSDCRSATELVPAFYAGARFHFGDTTALTMKIGFPTFFSVGVSFF